MRGHCRGNQEFMTCWHGRLYQIELEKSCHASTVLGVGVAMFQALSNLAINGVVLLVVAHGGFMLTTNQVSPGHLMAFLVATQTIQRFLRAFHCVTWLGKWVSVDHWQACPSCLVRW